MWTSCIESQRRENENGIIGVDRIGENDSDSDSKATAADTGRANLIHHPSRALPSIGSATVLCQKPPVLVRAPPPMTTIPSTFPSSSGQNQPSSSSSNVVDGMPVDPLTQTTQGSESHFAVIGVATVLGLILVSVAGFFIWRSWTQQDSDSRSGFTDERSWTPREECNEWRTGATKQDRNRRDRTTRRTERSGARNSTQKSPESVLLSTEMGRQEVEGTVVNGIAHRDPPPTYNAAAACHID